MRIYFLADFFGWIVLTMLSGILTTAHAQTTQTPDTIEQRRSVQQQEEERLRRLQAPDVRLQTQPLPGVSDGLTLPPESPCFNIQHLLLEVPDHVSPAIRAAGASTLPQDPFRRGSLPGNVSYDVFSSWSLYKPQGMPTTRLAAGFNVNFQM